MPGLRSEDPWQGSTLPDGAQPQQLGPYRLLRVLGEGGMGVVHLADAPHGGSVAVKVLRPHIAGDATGRARLAREVSTLRRVSGPRVAAVLDADVEGSAPYVVTRFVDGPSLDEVVRADGPLHGESLLRLAWGLLDALCVIHAAGVVHRDLKPANVLLERGEPVVIDFGIAQVADDARLTMTGLFVGTPGYLAPEIVDGRAAAPASDVHAWAGTVAYAATGRPPFGRGPLEVVLYNVGRGAVDLEGVPAVLAPLLRGALSTDPGDRLSAGELRERVGALLGVRGSEEPVTTVLPVPPHTMVLPVEAPAVTRAFPTAAPTRGYAVPPAAGTPPPAVHPWSGAPAAASVPPAPAVPVTGQWSTAAPAHPPYEPPAPSMPSMPPMDGSPQRVAVQAGASPMPTDAGRASVGPRPVVSVAGLCLVAALGAVAPYLASVVVVLLMLVTHTVERASQRLAWRRERKGVRRSDAAMVLAGLPWHAVSAVVMTVLSLPVVAVMGAVCAAPLLLLLALVGVDSSALLALSAAALALAVWWGPGGGTVRRGSRRMVNGLAPGTGAAGVLSVSLLVAALALGVAAASGYLSWAPMQEAPVQRSDLPVLPSV